MHKHRTAGFTLMEIMISVVIMGIVIAIGLYNYPSVADRQRQDAAVASIVANLREAQREAVKRSADVYFRFSSMDRNFRLAIDANENGTYEGSEIRVTRLDGVEGASVDAPSSWARFQSDGKFVINTGLWTITVSAPGVSSKYIYVVSSGHIIESKKPLAGGG